MIRCEVRSAGGLVAIMLPDDTPESFALAVSLGSAYRIPATMTFVPIPADVTGRAALYWYPRTPPKENDGKHPNTEIKDPPCPGDADDYGAHVATG